MSSIPIIFANAGFVVVDKPSGLLSVPGKGEANRDCAVSRVLEMFPSATGPMVVHRLDMDTSGLLIVALNPECQRELSAQFERREVAKSYVAVLDGEVAGESGEIDVPMRLDVERRPRQIVDFVHGRPSLTLWRVLRREAAAGVARTRVEFEPRTGRSHQLRVHAASPVALDGGRRGGLGCPIVGDPLYGGGRASGPRMMLHAATLVFTDPGSGRPVRLESPAGF